jgi:hypothetical protein
MRRISLWGGNFMGQPFAYDNSMEVVLLDAAPVSRSYYAADFDRWKTVAPTCWSSTTQTPDADVPEEQVQSRRCMDCKQNVRGSSGSNGRACRFSQRLAVAPAEKLDEVYQIQLPATSIFGKTVKGNMPMQEYVRLLSQNNTQAASIVTKMYFDEYSAVPKLYFKPVRSLGKQEVDVVSQTKNHPDTKEAITLLVIEQSVGSSPFGITDGYEHKPNHS